MTTSARRPTLVTASFFAVMLAGQFFFLAAGTVIPVLPHFVEDSLGGGSLAVGAIVGAFAFSAVMTRPTAGRLGNRLGRRTLMVLGGLIGGTSLLLYGLAPSVAALALLRLITGVGEGFFFTGSATLVADLAPPDRRGEALSYFSVAVYLGLGLGPSIGQILLDGPGAGLAFAAAGCMSLLAAILSLRARDVTLHHDHPTKQPFVHPKALGPGAVLALGLMGFTAFQAYVPLYTDQLGIGGSQYVFLLYAAVVLVIRVAGARVPDAFGVLRAGTVATTAIAIGLGIAAVAASGAGLYAGTVVLGIGMALQYPALMAMAVNRAEDHERSAVVGTFTAFFDLAQGAGGLVLGGVAALAGYRASFAGGGVCALLALTLLRGRIARPHRAADDESAAPVLGDTEAWLPPGAE